MKDSGAVEVFVNPDAFDGVPETLLEAAVRHTLQEQGVRAAEISVTLMDDAGIGKLNREYLGKDRPTDVIAFSLGTDAAPLGDVYIGVEQAERQAQELGVTLDEELVRLSVHGTLHVLGHDHPEGTERTESPMFVLQERLVGAIMKGRPGA